MNTAVEEFCADPIMVKCPICWNHFQCSPRWLQPVALVECPKCTVVIRVKAALLAQTTQFNPLSTNNQTNPAGRLDASHQNP
jgi:hypothetical protein